MKRQLARWLRHAAARLDPMQASPPPPLPPPQPSPPPPLPRPQETAPAIGRDVGLRDATSHGWFDGAAGMVYPGVPVGPQDVVADIGCGDGGAASFCARAGARLLLADIDAPRLAAAAARLEELAPGRITAVASDADPLPFPDAVATRVVCTEVIEHVPDPAVLLGELARIAAPGALLLLSCPDPRSEAVQKSLAPDILFRHPNHIRIVGHAELRALAEAAGFEILSHDFYGFYWAVWWAFFWETGTDFWAEESHPVLEAWARVWSAVLDFPEGHRIRAALDAALPKSQVIVARKVR